jgi:hypothetical protein
MTQRFRRFCLHQLMGDHQLVLNAEQSILSELAAGELIEQRTGVPGALSSVRDLFLYRRSTR